MVERGLDVFSSISWHTRDIVSAHGRDIASTEVFGCSLPFNDRLWSFGANGLLLFR
jgi:hypothetical protein